MQRGHRTSVSAGGERDRGDRSRDARPARRRVQEDTDGQADRIAAKLARLRIFDDADGRMNEPLGEREVLCVSQFTLLGDTSRGNRPSWTGGFAGEKAEPLYERVCGELGAKRGAFGEHMVVELENDGPVTLILES